MGFFEKFADFFSGGVVKSITETVKAYFPPSMSEGEKAHLAAKIQAVEHEREKELMALAIAADREVTDRAAQLEGTAKDLAGFPVVGRLVLFLRGCMRPMWGYGTAWGDFLHFTGVHPITMVATDGTTTPDGMLFIIINILVLGFLFGERTVKNLMPLFTKFMEAKGLAASARG